MKKEFIDEERISNKDAREMVISKQNFVGSHTYGEDLGDLGLMYVAYSYGEQHPLYLWDEKNKIWYYNYNDYILEDGKPNKWTRKHARDLKPSEEVLGRTTEFLKNKIYNFKETHNIGDNSHSDLEPGEK